MYCVCVCAAVLPLVFAAPGPARGAATVPADWWTCDTAGADGVPVGWTRVGARGDVAVDRQVKVQGAGAIRLRHDATHRRTVIHSAVIPVDPLTRYRLDATIRRSAGLFLHWQWQTGTGPATLSHSLLMQTRGWTPPWPGYKPLPPVWTETSGTLSTGRDVRTIRLQLTSGINHPFKKPPVTDANWLDALKLVRLGPVLRVKTDGPNLFLNPSFETPGAQAAWATFPHHWASWWGKREKVSLATESPHSGKRCLRIALGPKDSSLGLVGPFIDIQPGHLYRFSLWYRGQGTLTVNLPMWADSPGYYYNLNGAQKRRGGLQIAAGLQVKTSQWQQLTGECVPDVPGLQWVTAFILVQGAIELDDVSLVAVGK